MYTSITNSLIERSNSKADERVFTFLKNGSPCGYLTYKMLHKNAQIIATHITKRGLSGQPILLMYTPNLNFINALYGCFYAGAIAVPIYPPYTKEIAKRIQHILKDSTAKVVFTDYETTFLLQKLKFIESLTDAPIIKNITKYIYKKSAIKLPDWQDITWIKTDQLKNENLDFVYKTNSENIAILQYTSGSTAEPKGVMVTHANIMHNLKFIEEVTHLSEKSIGMNWVPLQHDMGLISGILQPVFSGFHLILMSPLDFLKRPYLWLKTISDYRVTHSGGPSFSYYLTAKRVTNEQVNTLDLKSWRVAFNSAEPVRWKHIQAFYDKFFCRGFSFCAFVPAYGLAESTLGVCIHKNNVPFSSVVVDEQSLLKNKVKKIEKEGTKLISSGKISSEMDICIVDPDTYYECSKCIIGEIWVKSPSVAKGYFQKKEETIKTFQAFTATGKGPYLRTGDLGFIEKEELYITGRIKDVIIIRGQNYYPQDIEYKLENYIHELRGGCSAVFSLEIQGEESLFVVSELKDNCCSLAEKICHNIQHVVYQHFYLHTHTVVLIKSHTIPKTSSGKLQRFKCKEKFLTKDFEIIIQKDF